MVAKRGTRNRLYVNGKFVSEHKSMGGALDAAAGFVDVEVRRGGLIRYERCNGGIPQWYDYAMRGDEVVDYCITSSQRGYATVFSEPDDVLIGCTHNSPHGYDVQITSTYLASMRRVRAEEMETKYPSPALEVSNDDRTEIINPLILELLAD